MTSDAATNPNPTSSGRIGQIRTEVQPCESAAAHRSIGHVKANISTKPADTA